MRTWEQDPIPHGPQLEPLVDVHADPQRCAIAHEVLSMQAVVQRLVVEVIVGLLVVVELQVVAVLVVLLVLVELLVVEMVLI